ncbi:MAG: FkbM family methyltransferase [bacterium]|nr:FkbM family methyltransferase [bacterium]
MKWILRLFSRLSAYFKFDILWRLTRCVSRCEQRDLALRLLQNEAELISFRRGGTLWTAYAWDYNGPMWAVFLYGGFQAREIDALLKWMTHYGQLSDKKIILDVGAHVGTSSISFAQQTQCHMYAIEPVPENFALLQQNVHQNGLGDRITCIQKAISASPGITQMLLPADSSGESAIKSTETAENIIPSNIRRVVEVPGDTLGNIVRNHHMTSEQISFVWCDTEGSEANVIETGKALWKAGVPLYAELNPDALRKQQALELFVERAGNIFDRFIESTSLIAEGIHAPFRPIAELSMLIEALDKDKPRCFTDVLLLPGGYQFQPVSQGDFEHSQAI